MDAATAAAMSDPERNPAFRRCWQEACTPSDLVAGGPPAEKDAVNLSARELLEQWRRERAPRCSEPST
jgi:hypothetical protein